MRLWSCVLASVLPLAVAIAASPAESTNPFGVWAYMGPMPTLGKTPHVRGKLVRAGWEDLEPAAGRWQWQDFDADLREAAAANLQIILVVFAGSHSPKWIYDQGVPRVRTEGVRGVQRDLYPYYLSPAYQELFKKMIVQVRAHVDTLPREVRSRLMAVQAGFSSTGDYGPYHGSLLESRYDISEEQWQTFYQTMARFYHEQYRDATPRIRLLFNPSNDPGRATELIEWLKTNCPHSIIKAGNTGHMYQINGEREQVQVLRRQLFARADDDYLRARSEFGEESRTGGWLEAPAWNMYSLLQAALYTGLDLNCFERGDSILADARFFPAFEFFNRYAGEKDPATTPGAWCALRDGLDAADTGRFPESKFGPAKLGNQERYLAIARAFAFRGARQGDPEGGMRSGIRNRALKALNDVGWEIYRGNYELFLEQIEPDQTSAGYWRVGPKDQPYGRYARGFDHAAGKDTLSFRLDPRFAGGVGAAIRVRVVYFDGGKGTWSVRYVGSGGAMKTATTVENRGTDRWQEITVPLPAALLGGKGPAGCDLQLQNSAATDTIFQLVEVQRTAK